MNREYRRKLKKFINLAINLYFKDSRYLITTYSNCSAHVFFRENQEKCSFFSEIYFSMDEERLLDNLQKLESKLKE